MEGLTFTNHFSDSPRLLRRMRGASGAEVCLMQGKDGLFVRKWATGKFAGKLRFQEEWLREMSQSGFTPRLIGASFSENFAAIDMEYLPLSKTLFEYLEDKPQFAEDIFERVLGRLQRLHVPKTTVGNLGLLRQFLQKKLSGNLQNCARDFSEFSDISRFEKIVANGQEFSNWPILCRRLFENDSLLRKMAQEPLVETHGDPTLSNILIDDNLNIFLIDPNNDNLFSTASLDFAKLIQSLSLGYESLENNSVHVSILANIFTYENPKPAAADIQAAFQNALAKKAPALCPKVLQVWLATHLARILPYRLQSGDRRAWIYFVEMLRALQAVNE